MRWILFLIFFASPGWAESVVAARTVRAGTLIDLPDLAMRSATIPGVYGDVSKLVGQEARRILYAGQAIRLGDVGPPALVDRNDVVELRYDTPLLTIVDEGRALGRAGLGERVRVMSLRSRVTLSGQVIGPGQVQVNP